VKKNKVVSQGHVKKWNNLSSLR